MTVDGTTAGMQDSLDRLKTVLLSVPSTKFECLAETLLGSLLGVPVRNSRSGDQRGGDGGVSGAGGRHLIYEARRYRDETRLDERSILGEIQQAVEREPYLEAWILVTTREAPPDPRVSERLRRAGYARLRRPSRRPAAAARRGRHRAPLHRALTRAGANPARRSGPRPAPASRPANVSNVSR